MNGTDLLSSLFESVPEPGEVIGGRMGGRIGGTISPTTTGPMAAPLAWLTGYGVPVVQAQDCDMAPGAAAQYCHSPPTVKIPTTAPPASAFTVWCLWHEAGHAADFVARSPILPAVIVSCPSGQFSTKHKDILLDHYKTIIEWTPNDDRAYKVQPKELWAEVFAAAICDPKRVPPVLLHRISFDLAKLGVPLNL